MHKRFAVIVADAMATGIEPARRPFDLMPGIEHGPQDIIQTVCPGTRLRIVYDIDGAPESARLVSLKFSRAQEV